MLSDKKIEPLMQLLILSIDIRDGVMPFVVDPSSGEKKRRGAKIT
jgi:hypothetical protein